MGIARIAEEPRALASQLQHFRDDRLVVGCTAVLAARDPRAENLFAQIALLRELQERLDH